MMFPGVPLLVYMLYITGSSVSIHVGQEFITAFLQNTNSSVTEAQFQLTITAFSDLTVVTVSLNDRNLSWSLHLNDLDSHTIHVPADVEMVGTGTFNSSILISSNYDVSVLALSSKTHSTARILVLPVDQLENQYYIISPNEENAQNLNEFAVINYDLPSKIQIYPKGWAKTNDPNYTPSKPIIVDLHPYQIFQFQSSGGLSGTRVLSNNIVAVLSGDVCSWRNNLCGHIYEQLYPVSSWGRDFYISPFPFQYHADIVYMMASQDTRVNFISNTKNGSIEMREGQVSNLPIRYNSPLTLSANVSIQVMFYCTGGIAEKIPFNPFFLCVPDISKYCSKYQVHGLQGFINAILITAKTSAITGIKFNRISLQGIRWKNIPGTQYAWAQYRYGRQLKSHIISHPTSMFSVLSVGISPQDSYGLSGVCMKGMDSCVNKQCRKKESCHMIDGKAACIPNGEAICQIWGAPHFQTFDGFTSDFYGTCTYILVKTCMDLRPGGDTTLPEFSIEANFCNSGSSPSSNLAVVHVHIHEYNITMVQAEVGFIRVNHVRWPLPILLDGGRIHITTSGFHALLETSFIRMRYDWNVFLFIKIPSSFYENVCGLCGNYNGIKDDDLETMEGFQNSDMVELGKSWKVEDEYPTCVEDCDGPCVPPIPQISLQDLYPNTCGVMSRDLGPFHRCHQILPPATYLRNCISDLVRSDGDRKVLCDAVSVYLVACHVQGIHVEEWRAKVGCEIECPENSGYRPCGNPCPETCAEPPASCQLPCMETCECSPGFVLHGGVCIPKRDCGHFCDGRYYPKGEIFWGDNGCKQRCTCDPNSNKVKCHDAECPDGQECAIKHGVKDCYPLHRGRCIAYGDRHYITYDNVWYNLQSTCTHRLSQVCDQSRGLTEFYIEISNRKGCVQDISCSWSLLVRVYGEEILLSQDNPGTATVNGVIHNLPIKLHMDKIQALVRWWDGVILTDFGLEVTFGWDSRVTVALPDSYAGAVCGLCGNFNGKMEDEPMLKNGEVTHDILSFEKSWRTMDQPQGCRELVVAPCALLQLLEKNQRSLFSDCGILLKNGGPFRDCHGVVNPEPYFQSCIHDFCYHFGRQKIFCEVIEEYAAACQETNGTVHEWRSNTFCPFWCPENSYYALCSYGHQKTCSQVPHVPSRDIDHCRESCVCKDDYVHEGARCVHGSDCGCVHDGIYYELNEIFYPTPNCDKKCLCQYGGLVECSDFVCGPHEVCQIKDGTKKCHSTEAAKCSVLGGSHYYTFDGGQYQFQGNCTYILTRTCSHNRSLPANFSVVLSVAIPKKVGVIVDGLRIVMTEGTNGTVQVNDVSFNLPLNLRESGVSVWQHGLNILLTTKFGLEVIYDRTFLTIVEISRSFYGQVCGLCGNYNGDLADDYPYPEGSLGIDEAVFGETWKEEILGTVCKNHCPSCEDRGLYEGKNFCGLLLQREGLFSACHNHVDPIRYFDNCVLNLCREQGDSRVLCQSLQSYIVMCQNEGITKIQWRSEGFCSLDCPGRSHYEICADSCRTTCGQMVAPATCSSACAEGCQCDGGHYLDGDKCVPFGMCGCLVEEKYYTLNENFLGENCLKLCTCQLGGAVQCKDHKCPEETTCKRVVDGMYICAQCAAKTRV